MPSAGRRKDRGSLPGAPPLRVVVSPVSKMKRCVGIQYQRNRLFFQLLLNCPRPIRFRWKRSSPISTLGLYYRAFWQKYLHHPRNTCRCWPGKWKNGARKLTWTIQTFFSRAQIFKKRKTDPLIGEATSYKARPTINGSGNEDTYKRPFQLRANK